MKTAILASLLASFVVGCTDAKSPPGREIAPGVRLLAQIADKRIVEDSGIAPSRRYDGIFWTHNDGGKPVLFAIGRDGATRAAFRVNGARFEDWEDIADDDAGHLFLADIGNNNAKRHTLAVYEIAEPDPGAGAGAAEVKRTWRLKFPGAPFDCEGLFIWKQHGYVISKVFSNAPAQIFRFPLKDSDAPNTLEPVATTKITSPVTGADISDDGRQLGVVAKNGAYVFRIDGDVARAATTVPHFTALKDQHVEACCFVRDGLLATSENRSIFLFTDAEFCGL